MAFWSYSSNSGIAPSIHSFAGNSEIPGAFAYHADYVIKPERGSLGAMKMLSNAMVYYFLLFILLPTTSKKSRLYSPLASVNSKYDLSKILFGGFFTHYLLITEPTDPILRSRPEGAIHEFGVFHARETVSFQELRHWYPHSSWDHSTTIEEDRSLRLFRGL